jgi:hypothetical protein
MDKIATEQKEVHFEILQLRKLECTCGGEVEEKWRV